MIPYDMLLFLSFILLTSVLALLLVRTSLRSKREGEWLRARAELEAKLIERIVSAESLEKYLSGGGFSKLDQATGFPQAYGQMKIIFLIAAGCGISFLGAVLLGLFAYIGLLSQASALIIAVVILASGLALLLMAFVIYRLSLAWGLMKREETGAR